jgi:antitoxin CptB
MSEVFDLKKIIWNCRRGMLELDVILLPFAERHFMTLSDTEKHTFVALLEEADPDLFNWLMGHGEPEKPELAQMIKTIRRLMAMA